MQFFSNVSLNSPEITARQQDRGHPLLHYWKVSPEQSHCGKEFTRYGST